MWHKVLEQCLAHGRALYKCQLLLVFNPHNHHIRPILQKGKLRLRRLMGQCSEISLTLGSVLSSAPCFSLQSAARSPQFCPMGWLMPSLKWPHKNLWCSAEGIGLKLSAAASSGSSPLSAETQIPKGKILPWVSASILTILLFTTSQRLLPSWS